jgi:mediator of RNA polymerase II transcription subunit 7
MLNEYRPHQAREALILMMEEQLEKKKAEIEDTKRMKAKIDQLLTTLPTENGDHPASDLAEDSGATKTGASVEEQEATWAALEEEMRD